MKEIWKFQLGIERERCVSIPSGAVPLAVQMQGDLPYLWALVDTTAPKVHVSIFTYGTGCPVAYPDGRHLGTYQIGSYVWHVFGPAVWP